MKIGYQGMEFSYSDFATDLLVKNFKDVEKVPLISSENVAQMLIAKEIDFGVVAVKNNIGGIVKETDKILQTNLFTIINTIEVEIKHCLFSLNKDYSDKIDIITSHPQALKQCEIFLEKNYSNCKTITYCDTAKAAEDLKKGFLSKTTGVICCENAGLKNNLFLIRKNIADKKSFTTFCLIKIKN